MKFSGSVLVHAFFFIQVVIPSDSGRSQNWFICGYLSDLESRLRKTANMNLCSLTRISLYLYKKWLFHVIFSFQFFSACFLFLKNSKFDKFRQVDSSLSHSLLLSRLTTFHTFIQSLQIFSPLNSVLQSI